MIGRCCRFGIYCSVLEKLHVFFFIENDFKDFFYSKFLIFKIFKYLFIIKATSCPIRTRYLKFLYSFVVIQHLLLIIIARLSY